MVSVLIITRKRTALLQKCLASLAPWVAHTPLQVRVLVNGEDAETSDWLRSQHWSWLEWEEIPLSGPGRARNLGLAKLRGDWIFLLDDDACVPSDYWERWARVCEALPGAAVIGGGDMAYPHGPSALAEAVSLGLGSILCTGPTAARHQVRPGGAYRCDETVLTSCNLWLRAEAVRAHQFPEHFHRAEETVYLHQLAQAGLELWRVPDLGVWHARRGSWLELFRTSFNSGHYRSLAMREARAGAWWFALPALFVQLHLLVLLIPALFPTLAKCWAFPVMAWSWALVQRARRPRLWPQVVALHWVIPFSYGAGFLWQRVGGHPWRR